MQNLKKYINKFIPKPEYIKNNRSLSYFKIFFKRPNLWYINKYSVSKGFAVGFFCAWLPIPFQMVVATFGAILFNTNLPISISLVWITNPLTMPFLFATAYKLGSCFSIFENDYENIEITIDFFSTIISEVFPTMLLGCLVIGCSGGGIGFLLIRLAWRISVVSEWNKRRKKRKR